jgi:ketosteroid isomerase-like protein
MSRPGRGTSRRSAPSPGDCPGTEDDDGATLRVFERWYAAHESGDVDGLADVLADDVAVHSLFRAGPARGRPDAVAHFVGVTSTFDDLATELVSRPAVADGTVLTEVAFTGAFTGELVWRGRRHRGCGQRFRVGGVLVLHVDAGAVRLVRTLFDRDDWLRQIDVAAD